MLNDLRYEKGVYYFDTDKGTMTFNINNGEIINHKGQRRKELPITAKERDKYFFSLQFNNAVPMIKAFFQTFWMSMKVEDIKIKTLQNIDMINGLLSNQEINISIECASCTPDEVITINNFLHSKNKEKSTLIVKAYNLTNSYGKEYFNSCFLEFVYNLIIWSNLEKRIDKEHFNSFKNITYAYFFKDNINIIGQNALLKKIIALSKENIIKIIAIAKKLYIQRSTKNCWLLISDFYCILEYLDKCKKLQIKPRIVADMEREMIEVNNSYVVYCEQQEGESFNGVYDPYKQAITFNADGFCVVLPKNKHSLILEGARMYHCVGGYADSVAKGKTLIVFIRKEDDIDTPYITAQINPKNFQLQQYFLAYDKHISATEDIIFKNKYQEYLNKMFKQGLN